jgi:choline kinase/phosphohistidine swiveling domain-containing protein
MKYIILAAGQGVDSLSEESKIPKCLIKVSDNETTIDNIISITQNLNIVDISIVGGYRILDIMKQYPQLRYFYNEDWLITSSLYSLFKVIDYLNEDDDVVVSYSDILYSEHVIKQLYQDKSKISIAYDSQWYQRYEGNNNAQEIEKIYSFENKLFFSKEEFSYKLIGEFTGLIHIPNSKVNELKVLISSTIEKNKKTSILDFLNILIKDKQACLIDIKNNWAELDSIQDIEHFKFGTKAETLDLLGKKLTTSKVLNQISFTVKDYRIKKKTIIQNIKTSFDGKFLIVRSSAINEDTYSSSMAGNYESILRVEKNNYVILDNAIQSVINSYTKNKQAQDDNNQILVQPYLENVTMSGVIFTKNLQTNSPYYVINYEESNDTEAVTSGSGKNLKTFICYRNFQTKIKDIKLQKLIKATREIESFTKYDSIDIEFAFVEKSLFVLQARPIAAKKNSLIVLEEDIDKEIKDIQDYIKIRNDNSINLAGEKIGYGVMPDWNPAEIIGINPKKLSFDLYKYLITDNIWAKSRKKLGYSDVKCANGLVSFAGSPYVDLKMSFNTFIPSELDDKLTAKLVDFFMTKLEKNPTAHDKVEFDIVITAFDFLFDKKMLELRQNCFTSKEIKLIASAYKKLTEGIINEEIVSIEYELNKSIQMHEIMDKILSSSANTPTKILNLLECCKKYGTLPFAKLARCGFVGSIFIKSLLNKNVISSGEYDKFTKSIHTIAKTFINDLDRLFLKNITKNKFISKYGHLRPGTYDITSYSYKDNFDNFLFSHKNKKYRRYDSKNFTMSKESISAINKEIENFSLKFNAKRLLSFIIKSTEARELSKFEFTKILSTVLDLIIEFCSEYDISREDAANLNLYDILKLVNTTSKANIGQELRKAIEVNKKRYLVSVSVQLPELIFNICDTEMFFYSQLKPNFITHHNVTKNITILKNGIKAQDIEGKIVLIENADPGFDWIFSHNIMGLVTKYGGVASHMAIRCAEFDLPAAIGCGDKIYNEIMEFNEVNLDCINCKIRGIN